MNLCLRPASCPYRLYPHDTLCTYGVKQLSFKAFFDGRSVIIGFQKTQIYQRFAGSQQEVFILYFRCILNSKQSDFTDFFHS